MSSASQQDVVERILGLAQRLSRTINADVRHQKLSVPLTMGQFRTLSHLAAGYATPAELAEHLVVTRPTITRLVDGLVRKGLVERTIPALESRNFRLFFYGQLISLVGTWTQQVAQAWLVWVISHSPLTLGIITGVQSLPVLLFSLGGGVIADRFQKRRVIIVTQLASMTLAL